MMSADCELYNEAEVGRGAMQPREKDRRPKGFFDHSEIAVNTTKNSEGTTIQSLRMIQ